jgi:hypothetical protein
MKKSARNWASTAAKTLAACATAALASATLTGCAATVSLQPAPDANNPKCASVTVRLPNEIDGNRQRPTDAQATSAWGTPAVIIERCGLPEVLASTFPCVTAGGIDWLVDAAKAPSYRFITFGRNPATEVIVDSGKASGIQALDALGLSISQSIPADRTCVAKTN